MHLTVLGLLNLLLARLLSHAGDRFGGRRLNALQKAYLLTALKPSTLLLMGNWPCEKPFDQYWTPGLMVVTPQPIVELLMPFAATFKAAIAAADAAKKPVPVSARGMADLLPYLAGVVWQDFLELMTDPGRADSYRNNPVHDLLLNGAQKDLVRWAHGQPIKLLCQQQLLLSTAGRHVSKG
jgi:hypothetical protein